MGETDDIQARLLAHLEEPNPFAAHGAPTGFSFELSSPGQRIARQRQIIVEFDPPGNGDSRSMRKAF